MWFSLVSSVIRLTVSSGLSFIRVRLLPIFDELCRPIRNLFTYDPGIFIVGVSEAACMIGHLLTNTYANERALDSFSIFYTNVNNILAFQFSLIHPSRMC